jgi:hypothetical protein
VDCCFVHVAAADAVDDCDVVDDDDIADDDGYQMA